MGKSATALFTVLLFTALCVSARADNTVPDKTNKFPQTGRAEAGCERLPLGWTLDGMLQALAPDKPQRPKAVRVLAWQVDEDDRPLRVERVLLWVALRDSRWTLAHLYRHPRDEENSWHVSKVYDAPYIGIDWYSAAPTRDDLEKFLKGTWWHFRPSDGFQILGSEVCKAAWQDSFGGPPWHAYSTK
jgi:hypothetical protein